MGGILMTCGERVKLVRKNFHLTPEAFGEHIGMKKNSISQIETGKNALSEQVLKFICREFGVSEDWLRTGNGTMFNINIRLKKLRKEFCLTQQEFADRIDISRGNIASYEVGKNAPSNAVISLICREFNVNKNWLQTGNGDMFSVNTRLKELRQALNVTQQQFADRLGIKRNTVATYETSKSSPSDAAVVLICREFNVDEHWLRTGVGNMFIESSSKTKKSITCNHTKTNLLNSPKLNERLRKLRKFLDMTQQSFGAKINIKGNTIAQWESGRNEPSDSSILLICREYSVNETWLRTGTGEMFVQETPDEEFMRIAKAVASGNSETDRAIRKILIDFYQMDNLGRKALISFIRFLNENECPSDVEPKSTQPSGWV